MARPVKRQVPKQPKAASKTAAKQLNKTRGKAIPKRFGKTVMTTSATTGQPIGYGTLAPTQVPKMRKRKATTKQGRAANKKARNM